MTIILLKQIPFVDYLLIVTSLRSSNEHVEFLFGIPIIGTALVPVKSPRVQKLNASNAVFDQVENPQVAGNKLLAAWLLADLGDAH